MKLRILKSAKILEIWDEERCLHRFAIGVGRAGAGHKQREGDFTTPEGEYLICVKNPKSKYYLSLGINYPNPLDAEDGLRRQAITQAEYQSICEAHHLKKTPPWKTALGGEIYIHGHLEKQNWSQGCIRLNDSEMEILFQMIDVGTPVLILP